MRFVIARKSFSEKPSDIMEKVIERPASEAALKSGVETRKSPGTINKPLETNRQKIILDCPQKRESISTKE
jgi:hypothetical protein